MSTRVSDNKRIPNERQTPKGFNALWETIIGCDRWNPHPSLVRGFQLNLCGMHYMPCNHLLGHRADNICGGGARRELCLRSGVFRSCKQYQVPSPSPSLSLSSCHGLVHRLNYWQQQKQQHELDLELIFFLLLSLSLNFSQACWWRRRNWHQGYEMHFVQFSLSNNNKINNNYVFIILC